MKKLLFVFTLLFFCWGCKEDDLVIIDDNLIGVWESQGQTTTLVGDEYLSIHYTTCGVDSLTSVGNGYPGVSFEFFYPNNYILHSNYEVISTGTFYNNGNTLFLSGNFKQIFITDLGEIIGDQNIENINFNCSYSISDTLLNFSKIVVCTPFEINTGFHSTLGGGDCMILFNNSSLQHYINNWFLWLDDRVYNKIN